MSESEQPISQRPLSDELRSLGEQVAVSKLRERELEVAAQRIADEAAELAEEIVECHATGDEARAVKLGRARARLEGVATREAGERLEGAKRAVRGLRSKEPPTRPSTSMDCCASASRMRSRRRGRFRMRSLRSRWH